MGNRECKKYYLLRNIEGLSVVSSRVTNIIRKEAIRNEIKKICKGKGLKANSRGDKKKQNKNSFRRRSRKSNKISKK